jgi:hypothetical protein
LKAIVYLDDNVVERVLVQRFEPGMVRSFASLSERLVVALDARPVDDLLRLLHRPANMVDTGGSSGIGLEN